jgi:2'-5' RNA ligase
MRCFIAVNIPKEIKDYLADIILQLDKQNHQVKIKWVEQENIHLTLTFLGEITDKQAALLLENLIEIKFEPFIVNLDNISAFPNIDQPRVLKIGIMDKTGQLRQINSEIKQLLPKLKIAFDDKPFSSHLTLGRMRDGESRVNLKINVEPLSFQISNFDLMKSQLTPTGPIYTKLN